MNTKICKWAAGTYDAYIDYHNREWGVPVHEDKTHFEFLVLEGAQAGLSWRTILNKRAGYRDAFKNFDVLEISKFSEATMNSLMDNPFIVRNKLKIASVINNAKAFLNIQNEFHDFDHYVWGFVDHEPITGHWTDSAQVPSENKISQKLSQDLKKRGFKFVGSTIMYAYMQAVGMVNDHTTDCYRYLEINRLKNS
jgi:DNA-3-methyladenine glycosylase I